MKTDLFQSCGHCWVFQICWHIECSTFTASSFRIWNCSTGIPSPPLALFVVMLPKAHLTSHSWMSGSRWVICTQFTKKTKSGRVTIPVLRSLLVWGYWSFLKKPGQARRSRITRNAGSFVPTHNMPHPSLVFLVPKLSQWVEQSLCLPSFQSWRLCRQRLTLTRPGVL